LGFLKGLTLTQAGVIALVLLALIPAYFVYRVLGDPELLDRFKSSYRVIPSDSGCTIREAAESGGSAQWSITTGFAMAGTEQYTVGVILDHEPADEGEVAGHCATLLLIVEKMHEP
jgi:hypothetical protein